MDTQKNPKKVKIGKVLVWGAVVVLALNIAESIREAIVYGNGSIPTSDRMLYIHATGLLIVPLLLIGWFFVYQPKKLWSQLQNPQPYGWLWWWLSAVLFGLMAWMDWGDHSFDTMRFSAWFLLLPVAALLLRRMFTKSWVDAVMWIGNFPHRDERELHIQYKATMISFGVGFIALTILFAIMFVAPMPSRDAISWMLIAWLDFTLGVRSFVSWRLGV